MAVAKLKVTDPNGKLVFDSSRDRVMSFIKSEVKVINLNGTTQEAVHRITHPSITPDGAYVTAEFLSWEAASNVTSVYGSGGYQGIRAEYFNGYADVKFPGMSVYPGLTAKLSYTIKAYKV